MSSAATAADHFHFETNTSDLLCIEEAITWAHSRITEIRDLVQSCAYFDSELADEVYELAAFVRERAEGAMRHVMSRFCHGGKFQPRAKAAYEAVPDISLIAGQLKSDRMGLHDRN